MVVPEKVRTGDIVIETAKGVWELVLARTSLLDHHETVLHEGPDFLRIG
jgi:hypothetical protein